MVGFDLKGGIPTIPRESDDGPTHFPYCTAHSCWLYTVSSQCLVTLGTHVATSECPVLSTILLYGAYIVIRMRNCWSYCAHFQCPMEKNLFLHFLSNMVVFLIVCKWLDNWTNKSAPKWLQIKSHYMKHWEYRNVFGWHWDVDTQDTR